MTEFDPQPVLAAALADDGGELHRLARELGPSMRTLLYHAGWRMLNALAAEEANLDRLRKYARQLSPEARAVLQAYAESADAPPANVPAVTANALRIGGLINSDGTVTEDGREVLRLLKIDAMLKVRDTALSDEDLDHEDTPAIERVRGVWPR